VDARYFGLTPAQYIVVALVAWGVFTLTRRPVPQAGTGGRSREPPRNAASTR
jgi:hypothetical protein